MANYRPPTRLTLLRALFHVLAALGLLTFGLHVLMYDRLVYWPFFVPGLRCIWFYLTVCELFLLALEWPTNGTFLGGNGVSSASLPLPPPPPAAAAPAAPPALPCDSPTLAALRHAVFRALGPLSERERQLVIHAVVLTACILEVEEELRGPPLPPAPPYVPPLPPPPSAV